MQNPAASFRPLLPALLAASLLAASTGCAYAGGGVPALAQDERIPGDEAIQGPLVFSRNSPLMKGFSDSDAPFRLVYKLGRPLRDFYRLENIVNEHVRMKVHTPGFQRPGMVQGFAALAKLAHGEAVRQAQPALSEFESEYLLALSVAEVVRHTYRVSPVFKHWGDGHVRHGESAGEFGAEISEMLKGKPPFYTSDPGVTFLYQAIGEAVGLKVEGVVGTGVVWKGFNYFPIEPLGGFEESYLWTINVVRFKNGQAGLLNISIAMLATEMWGKGNPAAETHRPFADVILPKTKYEVERFYSLFCIDPAAPGMPISRVTKLNFRPYRAPSDLGFCAYSVFTPANNDARMRIDRQIDAYLALDRRFRL